MSAQDMTVSELLGATEILLPTSPVGATLRGHEVFSPFVGLFDEARDVLAAAPPETSELGRITAELETVDADHDREIRFIVGFLLAFNYYWKPELRTEAQRIRQALFSEGTSLVNRSLSHEAGAAATRESALTPELRSSIVLFRLPDEEGGAQTLQHAIDRLQGYARRVGELLEARAAAGGTDAGPTPRQVLDAKRRVIAIVGQILDSYRLLGDALDPSIRTKADALRTRWNDAVRVATERAERRREAERLRREQEGGA